MKEWKNKQPVSGQGITKSYSKLRTDLMHTLELSLQDPHAFAHPVTTPTGAREFMMLTLASPGDFDLE